jgi:fatty-acyl-CoA synthase
MGLIGFVLAPVMHRVPVVYLPPLLFLKRPVSWLQTMTRHKGSIAYAPNFAYALCQKRIREKDLEGIDLSTWRVAGCGAEPIRPETLENFARMMAPVGFKAEALLPSYGMAESSLAVAFQHLGGGVESISVDGEQLWAENQANHIDPESDNAVRLVSCGRAFPDHKIEIFAPDDALSEKALPAGSVGEIRIAGPSVMRGYWEDVERTTGAFAGLFICGRSKEVVIVNGRNYYPQDMEWEAAKVEGVRKGNVVAFGARAPHGQDSDRERVIVAFEMQSDAGTEAERAGRSQDLAQAVRKAVQEGMSLTVDDAVALPPGALPKTSSGKLQRAKTRELYEAGELAKRTGAKQRNTAELVKEAAKSQLSYLKLAVLSTRRKK